MKKTKTVEQAKGGLDMRRQNMKEARELKRFIKAGEVSENRAIRRSGRAVREIERKAAREILVEVRSSNRYLRGLETSRARLHRRLAIVEGRLSA